MAEKEESFNIVITDSELKDAFKSSKNFDKFYSKQLQEVKTKHNKLLDKTLIKQLIKE